MLSLLKLVVWGILMLPTWALVCMMRSLQKKPRVDNCVSWAMRKWDNHGGYVVIRWCRSNKYNWFSWPHFMWLPAEYHHDLRHYVPKDDDQMKHAFPAPFFEGKVQQGDPPETLEN